MVGLLLAVAFFAEPAVMEMPRAEAAYLVKPAHGLSRLEDRYNVMDLWVSRAVRGRWVDEDLRVLTLADLDSRPPALTRTAPLTRTAYTQEVVPLAVRDEAQLLDALTVLSPVAPDATGEFTRPHQNVRGYRDIRYYQGTNTTALVCAYLPDAEDARWRMVSWELAPQDDFEQMKEAFERDFLYRRLGLDWTNAVFSASDGERELLRRDAQHSIAAYPGWHFTSSPEFVVLDNLPSNSLFVRTLADEMPRLRAGYARTMPSDIDGSNTLAVIRIYANRADYLDAVGDEMKWSAAYWSPIRRELVAYLPANGEAELMRTIRHEAFHQYLSYATAMIPTSPWLNEGYAQYFENPESADWRLPLTTEDVDRLAQTLPDLLKMDYAAFYDGSDEERRVKYRLAWSLAYFIENGAPNVRSAPFANLKRDYLKALFETRDMRAATETAFGSPENVDRFIAEWAKYWKDM